MSVSHTVPCCVRSYKLRVEALLMKEEFKQTLDWLKPAIDAILLTADQLKESVELNEILYTILLAGNFLNSVSLTPSYWLVPSSSACIILCGDLNVFVCVL